jgi:hypothetical protein
MMKMKLLALGLLSLIVGCGPANFSGGYIGKIVQLSGGAPILPGGVAGCYGSSYTGFPEACAQLTILQTGTSNKDSINGTIVISGFAGGGFGFNFNTFSGVVDGSGISNLQFQGSNCVAAGTAVQNNLTMDGDMLIGNVNCTNGTQLRFEFSRQSSL